MSEIHGGSIAVSRLESAAPPGYCGLTKSGVRQAHRRRARRPLWRCPVQIEAGKGPSRDDVQALPAPGCYDLRSRHRRPGRTVRVSQHGADLT